MNKITLALAFFLGTAHHAYAVDDDARASSARQWANVPWTIRYMVFVDAEKRLNASTTFAKALNAADGKHGRKYVYLDAYELLPPPTTIVIPGAPSISIAVLNFDAAGHVTNNPGLPIKLTGKLTQLDRLVLIRDSAPAAKPYRLSLWSQGIPGASSFSPAPCTTLDSHRYEDDWKRGSPVGDFGCREWTAQLKQDERPYIDVTTYTRRGNFIGEFVGWSRFQDTSKPVIGMHGKKWLCLHDCPAGETPGIIPDFKAWLRKHNYPMPIRPAYQPEYPNKNYKDDLDEFYTY